MSIHESFTSALDSGEPTICRTESEMIAFGRALAKSLTLPQVIELVGDVGTGKTTITRGLAEGLGIKEPVTSPSFTISKQYAFPTGTLIHYDFYRLPTPGLMQEDFLENIADKSAVVVVEWADSIADFLPADRLQLQILLQEDGSRLITKGKSS